MKKDTILQNIGKSRTYVRRLMNICSWPHEHMFVAQATPLLRRLLMLVMLVLGATAAWGQTDYSGTYYIASNGNEKNDNTWSYNPETPVNNFYLVPASNPQQSNGYDAYYDGTTGKKPFLTTFKTNQAFEAVWIVEKVTDNDGTFYYIKHAETGQYVIFEPFWPNNNNQRRRKCMHLDVTSIPETNNDNYKFVIEDWIGNYGIVPKSQRNGNGTTGAHKYWNLADSNNPQRYGLGSDNQWWNGLVGLYQLTNGTLDVNSKFIFEDAHCVLPTISYSNTTGEVTMVSSLDAKIYYTTDGSTSPDLTQYGGENATQLYDPNNKPTISVPTTFKAIAVRCDDGADVSPEATVTIGRLPSPDFVLTNDGRVQLACDIEDVDFYYEMGDSPSDPTTSSTHYSDPIENAKGKVIKAIAVKDGWLTSDVANSGTIEFFCANPFIRKASENTFAIECSFPTSGVTIRYSLGSDPAPTATSGGTVYTAPVSFSPSDLPLTIKAIAVADDFNPSNVVTKTLVADLSPTGEYYEIASADDFYKFIDMVNGVGASSKYKITGDFTVSSPEEIVIPFTGELTGEAKADGSLPVISGLNHAIFNSINGGTVKNVMLDNVTISGSGNKGAIANEATGASRIYNCGILATDSEVQTDENGYTEITTCSSTISGGHYVGGLVGLLDGSSRVINCFSYANITGGREVGGIVGHNNVSTTSANLKTMVMNCMFYGDITGGSSKAPIYNGKIITNLSGSNGVSNFNYFWAGASYVQNQEIDTEKYNCALSTETRYLQRFEFFRPLLNSNRALAAWWATGNRDDKDKMLKWVMEPSQIGTATPYPILKAFDRYPSVVNVDVNHSESYKERDMTIGSKLSTLTVNIQMGSGGAGDTHPVGAAIIEAKKQLILHVVDKDPAHFNFNYYKVQLPYYNDVGTNNYRKDADNVSRVVTGWKIVRLVGEGSGTHGFSTGTLPADATATVDNTTGDITLVTPYNFADRKCTNKDLFSSTTETVGGRVFNQGAYFDVPEGVTSITIEPYWAKCVYVSDQYPDVVYNQAMSSASNVTTVGTINGVARYTNGQSYSINGESQVVYTSMASARDALSPSGSVYDNAIVLVGNVHSTSLSSDSSDLPYTIMSIDDDHDNEPDYSYILRFDGRVRVHPVRIDFLNVIGLGMAQKSTGGTGTYNFGIMQPKGWFECTNTGLFRVTQLEYDRVERENKPIILHGGVIEQWVTIGETEAGATEANAITYYHIGGNVWFKEFHIGAHQDKNKLANKDDFYSPHPPISVSGGDYDQFYLTGYYNTPDNNADDNAECYINGGRFGKMAGTGMQGIGAVGGNSKGNIIWQIDNADIDEFYAGGINAAHIAEGSIYTVISNSRVDQFCGGPKFGNMNNGTRVVTNAKKCTFRTFFGAGYGGNSYNRRYPNNQNKVTNINWNSWVSDELRYRYTSGSGVETRIDYQFIPMSGNTNNVARLFVDHVSFSLATTHNVTSKLTDCTITTSSLGRLNLFSQCIGNFYGGGSLGKVTGNVNSTLTNCKVEGSVYGAGYSATLPTVSVMAQRFQKQPHYDENLGAYLEAELPSTTTYTWVHADEVNSTGSAIKPADRILYTEENLEKSNLGSVSGAVILTITTADGGKSKIGTDGDTNTGHVYGGGDESYVSNSEHPENAYTVVNLSGDTQVLGNVFGGGNQGLVTGSATVNIE